MRPPAHAEATVPLGTDLLSDGQVVTVLAGVGLDLVRRHRSGRRHGVIHPVDLVVGPTGRPGLALRAAPPGWGEADDVQAWLRLAHALARPGGPVARAVAGWARDDERGVSLLVPLLLGLATPEPVSGPVPMGDGLRRRSRRGRHAARRRSWGPGTRTRQR